MYGVRCRYGRLSFDPMRGDQSDEDEWRNAVWDYVTKAEERDRKRERAAERRHTEVIEALGKVEVAVSSALNGLRRAA